MRAHLHPDQYVGMDLSAAELRRAVGAGVVQADATRLPLGNGAVDAVIMSMALQLVPWEQALTEVARVLRPGGVFVATVPVNQPLSAADWLRYGRLSVALRHKVSYPNDEVLAAFAGTRELLGVSDESRAFIVDIRGRAEADLLLDSLYLPGVSAVRLAAGRKVVTKWIGQQVAVPIRRIVLSRA
jgi:SAM-dependent methyltransferase